MKKRCPLCKSNDFTNSNIFIDAYNNPIEILTCKTCQALTPNYDYSNIAASTERQIKYHEDWWQDSTKEELDEVLSNLMMLVENIKPYLENNGESNTIIEIGSGRGSLLRALIDSGYDAYGCEPSVELVKQARKHYALTENRLYNVKATDFLKDIAPKINRNIRSFILWHVLEHLEDPLELINTIYKTLEPNGSLIIQLPLITKKYIYPEHYFFPSKNTLSYIASKTNLELTNSSYDYENMFITACYRKKSNHNNRASSNIQKTSTISPMSEAIDIRESFISQLQNTIDALNNIIKDKINGAEIMTKMIEDRNDTINAQTALIDSNVAGMNLMSKMIEERDISIKKQASDIDKKNAEIKACNETIQSQLEFISTITNKLSKYETNKLFKLAKLAKLIR